MLTKSTPIKDMITGLWQLIGNTPMIEISCRYKGGKERSTSGKNHKQPINKCI